MASQKQLDYMVKLGYKGSLENITAKNAFNIIQGFTKERKE